MDFEEKNAITTKPDDVSTTPSHASMNVSINANSTSTIKPDISEPLSNMAKNNNNKSNDTAKKDGGGSDIPQQFAGLPIESLICRPIIAAAEGQQQLTAVYIDGIKKLAYGKDGKTTNTLDFNYQRPVQKADGSMATVDATIKAPLLSLVPVPAFTMDELVVDFNMEVKTTDMQSNKLHEDLSTNLGYKSWFGLDTSIVGNVSSDSEHKRQTDSSATYKIHARAVQQRPSEGMAKLTSLFAQSMEPITNNK